MILSKKLFYIFLPLLLGGIIAIIIHNYDYYLSLIKPPLAPPKILFPIMWTIIYLFMGISFYLYKKNTNDNEIDKVYYTQLGVNLLWPILFFSFRLNFISSIWIILLLILVVYLLILFYKLNKASCYLNILYLCWCLFATYLTVGIWILN